MAASHQNGQNPQVRCGNDAPGQPWRVPNRTCRPFPRRVETRIKRGFPHFHSDDGGGLPGSDKAQPC
jgi:hypothetical protein